MPGRSFRAVEFTDPEGDVVVRHAMLTDPEAEELMRSLIEAGATGVSVYDLTSPQSVDAGVTSGDGKPLLAGSR